MLSCDLSANIFCLKKVVFFLAHVTREGGKDKTMEFSHMIQNSSFSVIAVSVTVAFHNRV